jgi:hypothetical protein
MSANSPQGNNSRFPGYRKLREGEIVNAGDIYCRLDKDLKSAVKVEFSGRVVQEDWVGYYHRPISSDLATALSRIEVLEGALRDARKGLEILNDFSHNEECGAFGSGYDEDEIAENPLECLKGCDCGLAASWRATEIIDAALSIHPESTGGENAGRT